MKTGIAALVCLFVSGSAFGQSAFVQGTFTREIKRFSAEPGQEVYDATATGGTVQGAGFVAPHWTVGVEADLGGRSTTTRATTVSVSGRPTTVNTTYSMQRRSVSALVGYHAGRARVRIGCYAGWSFTYVRREIGSDAPAIVLTQPPETSAFADRVAGAIVGVDAAIEVVPHVAVVPSFRAQAVALTSDLQGQSFRPGVGVRVTF